MKIKEFWKAMCEENNFRFFTGQPFIEFKRIFDSLDPSILHYVPPISEKEALGLANGVYIAGAKSVVFIDNSVIGYLSEYLKSFNIKYKIPVLLVTNGKNNPLGLKQFTLDELEQVSVYMYEKEHLPSILIIEDEDLT